jgi:predicted Zn finger-like uncharacterized protein
MLSRCPACATVFRVDTVQIRARDGRVRCGRCHAVFDALDAMVELPVPRPDAGAPGAVPAGAPAPGAPHEPEHSHATLNVIDAPEAEAHHEPSAITADVFDIGDADPLPEPGGSMDTLVERTTDYWQRTPAVPADDTDAQLDVTADTRDLSATQPDPDITQPLDIVEPFEPVAPEAGPDVEPVAEAPGGTDAAWHADPLLAPLPAGPEPLNDPALQRIRRELYGEDAPTRRSRAATALWSLGILLLALLAAAQLAYHFRSDIAQAQPALKPLLDQACARLGCTVPAPREPDKVSIESSELTPAAGREPLLQLSALLRNGATFAQAWPHLELTLTDSADRAVVRRAIAPADYLPAASLQGTTFGAESEQAIRLLIDADNTGASGYRLYVFYP